MAKQKLTGTFSTENQLFDDLDKYRNFCVDFGYKYDESDLYNQRSYVYRQYTKFITGKPAKNQWDDLLKEAV